MRNRTKTQKNNTSQIKIRSPWRVHKVCALEKYRLHVEFMDGLKGFVDLSQLIQSRDAGIFKILQDQTTFQQVHVHYGAVTWPGELDLAPDAMYEAIRHHGEWILR